MHRVAAHLEACASCNAEFTQWRGMQRLLTASSTLKAPSSLGLQLRLAISHEKTRPRARTINWHTQWDNFVRPVALQALSGLAGALFLVGSIALLVGVAPITGGVLARDEPLRAVTAPHYLYSSTGEQPIITPDDSTVVVEADVNSLGKVYDYRVVSGTLDDRTRAEVRDQLMVQVYEPARIFGIPVRGRALVAFSGVQVKG